MTRPKKSLESLGIAKIQYLPFDRQLYYYDSTEIPECAEVIFFKDSLFHYGKGFVLRELIHDSLPDPALLKTKRQFYDSLSKANQ